MFDHLSITVGDIDKAAAFYDATLAALGASRLMSFDAGDVHGRGHGRDSHPCF